MDSLEAVFEIALEVNASHTNANAMQDECRRIGKLVGELIPILEIYVTDLLDGSGGGGAADVIECQGPFLKKPKHRVGVTSEKWDERYFRLYSNRLVYGKLNKGQFTPRSKPFLVNHLTQVGDKPSSPKKASASSKEEGKGDPLVLSLSFQESTKDKVEKEFFKFEDVAKGNEFRSKLLRIVECSRPGEEGHPSGGVSVVDRRWIENLKGAMKGAQETIAACTTKPLEVQIMPSIYASKLLAANDAIEGAIKGAALMAGVTAAAERSLASLGSDFQDLRDTIEDTLCASQSLSHRKQLEDLVAAFEANDVGAQRALADELSFSGGVEELKRSLAAIDPVQLDEGRGAEAPKGSRERYELVFLKRLWAAATGRGAEASAHSDSDSGSDYGSSYSPRKSTGGSKGAAAGSEDGSNSEDEDENIDLMDDFDRSKIELSGTFQKKKHHKKVWSTRTFRLYVDRLEYGIEINGDFKEKDHSPIKLTKRSTISPESDTTLVAQFPEKGAFKTRMETFSWDSKADAANFKSLFEEIIDRHKMRAKFAAGGDDRESTRHLDGINLFKTRKEDKKRVENTARHGTFFKLGKTSYQWQKRHYYLSREFLEYGSEHEQEDGRGAPAFFFVPGSQSPFPINSKLVILDKQDDKTACIKFTDESTSKSYEEKFQFEDGSIDEFLKKLKEQVNGHKRKDREVEILKEYSHYLQRIEKEPNYRSSKMREVLDALKKALKQFRMALDDMVANAKSQEAHGGYYFGKHELLETIKESKKVIKENASVKETCSFGLENVQKTAIMVANELFKIDLTREVQKPLESPGGSLNADMAREDDSDEVFAPNYSSSFHPPEILSDSLDRELRGIRNLIHLAGDGGDAQLLSLAEGRLSVIAAIRADKLQGLIEVAQIIDFDANPGEFEYCEARAKIIEGKVIRWEEEGKRKMRQANDPQQCDRMFVEAVLATAEEGATIHGEKVSWADPKLLAETRRRAKQLREQEEDPEDIVQAWIVSCGVDNLDAAMEMWTAEDKRSASLNPPPIMLWLRFTCLCHQKELVQLRLVIKRAIEKVSKKRKSQEPEHMLHFLHMLQTPKLMYDTVKQMQKELPLAQKWRFTNALKKLDPTFFKTEAWRKVFYSPRRFKGTSGNGSSALPSTVSAWLEITLGGFEGLGEEKLRAALSVAEEAGVRELDDLVRLKGDPPPESGGEGGRDFYERMASGNVAVGADGAHTGAAAAQQSTRPENVKDFELLIAIHAATSSFLGDDDDDDDIFF